MLIFPWVSYLWFVCWKYYYYYYWYVEDTCLIFLEGEELFLRRFTSQTDLGKCGCILYGEGMYILGLRRWAVVERIPSSHHLENCVIPPFWMCMGEGCEYDERYCTVRLHCMAKVKGFYRWDQGPILVDSELIKKKIIQGGPGLKTGTGSLLPSLPFLGETLSSVLEAADSYAVKVAWPTHVNCGLVRPWAESSVKACLDSWPTEPIE